MKDYLKSEEEVLQEQEVNAQQGLSEAQAARRLEEHGKNKLVESKRRPSGNGSYPSWRTP